MSHHESQKPIYFEVKRSKVKVTRHKTVPATEFLHSCECWLNIRSMFRPIRFLVLNESDMRRLIVVVVTSKIEFNYCRAELQCQLI